MRQSSVLYPTTAKLTAIRGGTGGCWSMTLYPGGPAQQLLNDAIASGSADRVVAFFRGFQREAGDTHPAPCPPRPRRITDGQGRLPPANRFTRAIKSNSSTSNIEKAHIPVEKLNGLGSNTIFVEPAAKDAYKIRWTCTASKRLSLRRGDGQVRRCPGGAALGLQRIAERADCARSLGYIQLYVGDRNFSRVIGGLTLTAANRIQFGLGEFSVIEVGSVVGVVGVVHDFSP
jgi:hypothetical protein